MSCFSFSLLSSNHVTSFPCVQQAKQGAVVLVENAGAIQVCDSDLALRLLPPLHWSVSVQVFQEIAQEVLFPLKFSTPPPPTTIISLFLFMIMIIF